MGEAHDVPLTFGTAEELARRDEVDLVVVTVKVPHHREVVTTALQAGKMVLCEWPLGNGLAEAEELAALARYPAGGRVARAFGRPRFAISVTWSPTATSSSGAVVAFHFRGGRSWGVNFHGRSTAPRAISSFPDRAGF
jgi:hypothetical protein